MAAFRSTYYATILYDDEAIEKAKSLHIRMLISPLHNKDIYTKQNEKKNPENKAGTLKKEHRHGIFLFDSLKSIEQAKAIVESIGGVGVEPVHSLAAYSRYLCHLDDSDKAQYDPKDIIEIGGASYKECCKDKEDKDKEQEQDLIQLTKLILENNISYYHEVAEIILKDYPELFKTLHDNAYYIHCIVISLATYNRKKAEVI